MRGTGRDLGRPPLQAAPLEAPHQGCRALLRVVARSTGRAGGIPRRPSRVGALMVIEVALGVFIAIMARDVLRALVRSWRSKMMFARHPTIDRYVRRIAYLWDVR